MAKTLSFLILIVILGAALRLFWLGINPPALNWDEVSHGYNAYSILKTGKDEWGEALPLANFRAYGDYPLPLNLYLTMPFIATLGLNDYAIRLPHAILGILTIIAVFFLTLGVTKRRGIALLAAFLAAVDPWLVFTSRFVLQSNLSVFLLTAAMACFVYRTRVKFLLPAALLTFGLTLYSYHTTRIFTPLVLVVMGVIYRKWLLEAFKKNLKVSLVSLFIFVLFFVPLAFILFNPAARARSNEVFLIDAGAVSQIEANRQSSHLPPYLSKLVYNKATYLAVNSGKNYLEYFSPAFLFLQGGTQYQFSVPGYGLLLLANLPFFYLGFLYLGKKALRGEKDYQLLMAWLIFAPIPAAITREHFAVVRATTMIPLGEVLSALGFFLVLDMLSKTRTWAKGILIAGYFLAGYLFLESYLTTYFTSYRTNYSWSWQYGYQEAVGFAKSHYADYDKIIVTKKYGEPHEFFLFFWPWDPAKYQDDPNLVRFFQSNWYWVDRFDKFYFVNDWQMPKIGDTFVLESKGIVNCQGEKCLLITSPGNYPKEWKKLTTINFLDGKAAFDILKN